jgi:hypothetical protein
MLPSLQLALKHRHVPLQEREEFFLVLDAGEQADSSALMRNISFSIWSASRSSS